MLPLILFVLAFVCWGIALILRKDAVTATPVAYLGLAYFALGALFALVTA